MPKRPNPKNPKNCFVGKKSPNYQYDFCIAGERERGTTRTRSAAEASEFVETRRTLMRQRQAAQRMGLVAPVVKSVTLFEACALFESKLTNVDATTSYQIENLCALLCPDIRDRKLADISTSDFAEYRRQRQARPGKRGRALSGATINREIELARRVWKHAAALDFDVGRMPNWGAVIHKGAEHKAHVTSSRMRASGSSPS